MGKVHKNCMFFSTMLPKGKWDATINRTVIFHRKTRLLLRAKLPIKAGGFVGIIEFLPDSGAHLRLIFGSNSSPSPLGRRDHLRWERFCLFRPRQSSATFPYREGRFGMGGFGSVCRGDHWSPVCCVLYPMFADGRPYDSSLEMNCFSVVLKFVRNDQKRCRLKK